MASLIWGKYLISICPPALLKPKTNDLAPCSAASLMDKRGKPVVTEHSGSAISPTHCDGRQVAMLLAIFNPRLSDASPKKSA